jgi:type IV pilus assembly protein PilV
MYKSNHGFSLIEVLVSMTIFSVGMLGLMGMYARSVTGYSDSKYRTEAALLADGLISDIWVNRANMASYAYAGGAASAAVQLWLNDVRATLPNGNATITVGGNPVQVQVTVTWQPPDAAAAHQHIEVATIQNP